MQTISLRFVFSFLVAIVIAYAIFAIFGLFEMSSIFTYIIHFFGGMWFTYLFLFLFSPFVNHVLTDHYTEHIKVFILALGFVALGGVVWEFVKYCIDLSFVLYLQESVRHVMVDLFYDLFGGGLVATYVLFFNDSQSKKE